MADYDTYSGLDFDNPDIATELEPKQITEEAVLQLINHIKLEYQPDGTVDAASDGPVKGKAVWQALHDAMVQKTIVVTGDSDKTHEQLYNEGTKIDVTKYVYEMKQVDETTGTVVKRAAIDVQFVPILYTTIRWGIPQFQGKTFTLFLSGDERTDDTYWAHQYNKPTKDFNGSTCELVWVDNGSGAPFYGETTAQSRPYYEFRRTCEFCIENDKFILFLHPMNLEASYTKIADNIYECLDFARAVEVKGSDTVLNWCGRMKIGKIVLSKGLI